MIISFIYYKISQNARVLNPQFAKFVENQESRPEVQNKLSALLIAPIQRVPRYKLLLHQLHKLTKEDEPDYNSLTGELVYYYYYFINETLLNHNYTYKR